MLEFFSKLSTHKGLCIVVILIGNVVAPFWFLFQFTPHLFETIDLLRLLILCLALGAPITIIGCLLIGGGWIVLKPRNVFGDSKYDESDGVLAVASYASVITAITFYTPAFLLFKGTHVSLQSAVNFSLAVAVVYYGIILAGLIVVDWRLYMLARRKAKTSSSSPKPNQDLPSSQP